MSAVYSVQLKPCPFPGCGSKHVEVAGTISPCRGIVRCVDCGASVIAPTVAEAKAEWNKRAEEGVKR